MIDKKENVLDILNKLGDIKFQTEVWINGKYWNRITDIDEAVNTLDDYNFFEDVEYNKMNLNESELEELKLFANKLIDLDTINFNISDPQWIKISEESKKISKMLETKVW